MLLNKLYSSLFIFIISLTPVLQAEVEAEQAPAPVETRTLSTSSPTSSSSTSDSSAPASLAGSAQNQSIQTSVGMSQLKNLTCDELMHSISTKLKTACNTLKEEAASCSGKYDTAAPICNTESNPDLLSTITKVQALMGAAQGLMNSCNNFGKAMNIAKMGMAGYSMACGALQKACDMSCSKATTSLANYESTSLATQKQLTTCYTENEALYKKSLTTTPPIPNIAAKEEAEKCANDLMYIQSNLDPIAQKDKATTGITVAAKAKVCKVDMTTLLGMAVINLGSLAQSKAMSDQCEKDSKSNSAATATAATDTTVDCALAANADKPICICKANPRLKGCEGVSTSLATNSTMSTGGSGSTSGKGLSGGVNNGTDSAINKQFPSDLAKTNKNDGTSSGGGGSGASSAGLSPSSDGTVGNAEAQLGKNSAGNANILSGEASGGGGGYRFGFGGGSSAARNLARNVAGTTGAKGKLSAMDWTNQVTSNAGKSNFDKIKVRYIENRTSLLNK